MANARYFRPVVGYKKNHVKQLTNIFLHYTVLGNLMFWCIQHTPRSRRINSSYNFHPKQLKPSCNPYSSKCWMWKFPVIYPILLFAETFSSKTRTHLYFSLYRRPGFYKHTTAIIHVISINPAHRAPSTSSNVFCAWVLWPRQGNKISTSFFF